MINADYTRTGIEVYNDNIDFSKAFSMDDEKLKLFLRENMVIFDRTDPEIYKNQWVLEFQTESLQNKARWVGDHSSGRIVTPWGDIISFGAYRDEFSLMRQPLSIKMPEPGEFYSIGGDVLRTPFKGNKQGALNVLNKIVQDKRLPPYYCLVDYNCTSYMLDICNLFGVNFNAKNFKLHMLEFFSPTAYKVAQYIPKAIKLIEITAGLCVYFCLPKSRQVSSKLLEHYPNLQPYFSCISDVFKKKLTMDSAYKVSKIQKEVEESRKTLYEIFDYNHFNPPTQSKWQKLPQKEIVNVAYQ